MDAITVDSRHDQVRIVERGPLAQRRFKDWSMAYSGPSVFVSRHVTQLLNDTSPSGQRLGADWLNQLMREFAAVLGLVS